MGWPANVKRPSQWRVDVLTGAVAMRDAPAAIQSWVQRDIFDAAKEICAAPDKGTRRKMLERVPVAVRPYVEAEVKRLWALK